MTRKLSAADATVTTGTAFVAGASGYVGSALVAELRRRDVRVTAHLRPGSSQLDDWRRRFDAMGAEVDVTPWEEDAMARTLARTAPVAIFALLGTTRARIRASGRDGDRDSYETVDYGLTALLLRAAVRQAPAARFVYLSSLGVGPAARGDYLRVRWRLEQELRASGMAFTIVRPSLITGPDRPGSRPAERIAAAVADAVLAVAGVLGADRLRRRYRSTTAARLAASLADIAYDARRANAVLTPDALP